MQDPTYLANYSTETFKIRFLPVPQVFTFSELSRILRFRVRKCSEMQPLQFIFLTSKSQRSSKSVFLR